VQSFECFAGDFVCGRCTKARASQQMVSECGATLIVCPASILQQWQSEITKHTQPGALKVITYLGQHKTSLESASAKAPAWQHGPFPASAMGNSEDLKGRAGKHSGQGVVSAGDLAGADVVLTTYDVLKRDVHHLADPDQQSKTFRTRKRYEVPAASVVASM
jgi:E3 ubiquitin-protein ligase SHPRH